MNNTYQDSQTIKMNEYIGDKSFVDVEIDTSYKDFCRFSLQTYGCAVIGLQMFNSSWLERTFEIYDSCHGWTNYDKKINRVTMKASFGYQHVGASNVGKDDAEKTFNIYKDTLPVLSEKEIKDKHSEILQSFFKYLTKKGLTKDLYYDGNVYYSEESGIAFKLHERKPDFDTIYTDMVEIQYSKVEDGKVKLDSSNVSGRTYKLSKKLFKQKCNNEVVFQRIENLSQLSLRMFNEKYNEIRDTYEESLENVLLERKLEIGKAVSKRKKHGWYFHLSFKNPNFFESGVREKTIHVPAMQFDKDRDIAEFIASRLPDYIGKKLDNIKEDSDTYFRVHIKNGPFAGRDDDYFKDRYGKYPNWSVTWDRNLPLHSYEIRYVTAFNEEKFVTYKE
tara:strand:+ start:42272 stop:43441 length:1170 start_codon:yes stop_codon:yes gene_type:complete